MTPGRQWAALLKQLRSMIVHVRQQAVALCLVTLGVMSAGCSDVGAPEDFMTLDSVAVPTASDPLTGVGTGVSSLSARLSADSTADSDLTYVSLPPGTVPDGGVATVTNTRLDITVTVAMEDGGFDPVAIIAIAGDELVITVQEIGGGTETILMSVPKTARPRVVRANPPPRKRDVPLNSRIVVVFSEPVAPGSEAGIRLWRASARVSGRVALSTDGLRAEIIPSAPLAPNTDYEILIPTSVRDLNGEALEHAVRSTFTTGTLQIAASVATDPTALVQDPNNGSQATFAMTVVRDDNGHFSGRFSIFYLETGWRVFGRIECFTLLAGSAWLAGVIEGSNDTASIGRALGWRAIDNGPLAGNRPDQLSLPVDLANAGLGTTHNFCANTPTSTPELIPRSLISGNIVVNGSGPPPPPTSDVTKIAFAVWPNGGIQVIDADGTNGHVLTSVEGDFSPVWSPDGTKLAFDRNRGGSVAGDIYVINSDGSGLLRLTSGVFDDYHPAWSPDGSKIAFGRNGALYVMNADGTGVHALTTGGYDFHPTWSPDGSRIAFASSRTGTSAVYVMASDGTDIRQITKGPANDYHPWWSPDGQRIAFQRGEYGFSMVYLVNPDGTELTKLVLLGRTPSWSHDSRVICFEQYGLTIVNADGSGMIRLGIGYDPAWSPGGTMPVRPQPFVHLSIAGGDAQSGAAGTTLPLPLTVRATRDDGSPVAGAHVSWYLPNGELTGNTRLSDYGSITNELGLASVLLTFGVTPPPLIPIKAIVTDGTGLTPGVEFTANRVP